MKNIFKISLLLLIITSNLSVFSQEKTLSKSNSEYKHTIGAQINSYVNLNHISDDYDYKQNVIALRYGIRFNDITLGMELFDLNYKDPTLRGNTLSFGIYSRYHFLQSKKTKPFVELNGYYAHLKTEPYGTAQFPDGSNEMKSNRFSYYMAPGISINLYKNRLTLDLMVKMSTERLITEKHFDPSYKINFHF